MPETTHKSPKSRSKEEEVIDHDMPTREAETQQKLDDAEVLLDEIDAVLDTETIEHVLTLSDLIRGGAKKTQQTWGRLFNDCGTASCALGAAIIEAQDRGLLAK